MGGFSNRPMLPELIARLGEAEWQPHVVAQADKERKLELAKEIDILCLECWLEIANFTQKMIISDRLPALLFEISPIWLPSCTRLLVRLLTQEGLAALVSEHPEWDIIYCEGCGDPVVGRRDKLPGFIQYAQDRQDISEAVERFFRRIWGED